MTDDPNIVRPHIERANRNSLLERSDWTQVSDSTVDKTAWAEYRQKLRDLPNQPGWPFEIIWPEKPK